MLYLQVKKAIQLSDRYTVEDVLKNRGEEVLIAALECDINPSNIGESYQGQYKNDEDFAQELAEAVGELPRETRWPLYCIDWEWAARELMMDYSESNGHYFRNI